jgi:hypothetical protein
VTPGPQTLAERFELAVRKHIARPLPPVSEESRLNDVRASLIGYDSHVAGVAHRVENGVDVPAEWLHKEEGLDRALAALGEAEPPVPASDLAALVDYKRGLDLVLHLAAQIVAERRDA